MRGKPRASGVAPGGGRRHQNNVPRIAAGAPLAACSHRAAAAHARIENQKRKAIKHLALARGGGSGGVAAAYGIAPRYASARCASRQHVRRNGARFRNNGGES
jgi:hypothetical protein